MNGRIEMCYNNVWFGICADYNSYENKKTICGVLGYSYLGNNLQVNNYPNIL